MKKIHRLITLSLAGIVTAGAAVLCLGQEEPALASLPYKPLWELSNPEGLPKDAKYEISFETTAKGMTLPPPGLKMHIEFRGAKEPLQVSKKGELQLPQNKTWADGEAKLVTNQPKGSLQLNCVIKYSLSKVVPEGEVKYRDLMEPLNIGVQILRAVSRLTGQTFDESSMHYRFQIEDRKDGNREITIYSKTGKIVYEPDGDGLIVLPYSRNMYDENPKIRVPDGNASFKLDTSTERDAAEQPATAGKSK